MAVAQGISTVAARVVQSALGTPGSSGSTLLRRVTLELNKENETYSSNEIVDHQQSTGATQGPGTINGTLNGELSAGAYGIEFANLLRKDWAATTAMSSLSITIAASGSNFTVTRAAGSFLTDGVKVGDVVRLTAGSFNAANLNKNLLVLSMTATVLTVTPLNGVAMVAEGPISSATVSVPGKKAWVPTSSHVNSYLTYEKYYSDLTRSELFTDVKVASADINIPATGIATCNFGLAGLGRTLGSSQVLTSPTAASTGNVLAAVSGKVVVNGSVTSVTGAQVQITGNVTPGEAEVGSNTLSDLQRGRVAVSGSFTAKFTGVTLQSLRDDQTVVTLVLALADGGTANAEFVTLVLPAIKIMSDTANDGEVEVIRTYSFVAQYNSSGGASASSHATICSLQDSLVA